jgi:hypothetical protein
MDKDQKFYNSEIVLKFGKGEFRLKLLGIPVHIFKVISRLFHVYHKELIQFLERTTTELNTRERMPFGNSAYHIMEHMVSDVVSSFGYTLYNICYKAAEGYTAYEHRHEGIQSNV